jgi:V8-like Glu-specific endopeptidase
MSPKPVSLYKNWLESLKENDPALYKELTARLSHRVSEAAFLHESAVPGIDPVEMALETIVREGRPAFFVKENRITQEGSLIEATAKIVVERMAAAAPKIEPLIPLVGRIDVDNFSGNATYVGTGWLVDKTIVITNRHVAELIATNDNGTFQFRPGRFGEDLRVAVDYRREFGSDTRAASKVKRVIWIQRDPAGADMALLEVDTRTDGTSPEFIPLSDTDPAPGADVAVVGYPARAPEHIVPDQARMDLLYGGHYDVKRVAPGMMGGPSRGWATHDCTTLGGNSGSVVIDIKTGTAVALHFAGLYLVENYAVPASTVRRHLKERPWQPSAAMTPAVPRTEDTTPQPAKSPVAQQPAAPVTAVKQPGAPTQVTFELPLTITITLGSGTISATANVASDTDV